MSVVREPGDRDVAATSQQWLDEVFADTATVEPCSVMSRAVDRHADGSRKGQLDGVLAVVRLDERGHRGLAAALDLLWGVRAKDRRDFVRLTGFARARVLASPTPAGVPGCRCNDRSAPSANYRPPTSRSLHGLVNKVLTAEERDREGMLRWTARKLAEHVAAGALTAQQAASIITRAATAAGIDPTAAEAALRG